MRNMTLSYFLLLSLFISCNAKVNELVEFNGCFEFNEKDQCIACSTGYNLQPTFDCTYSPEYCNLKSSEVCTQQNCLTQLNGQCITCIKVQDPDINGVCKYWNYRTQTQTSNINDLNLCSPTSVDKLANCDFCLYDKLECSKCSKGTFYFLGKCVASCPYGSYQASPKKCLKCHPRCKTCSSYDKCDTCSSFAVSFGNDCNCYSGFLFKGKCEIKCPTFYKEDKICVNRCFDSEERLDKFPYFDKQDTIATSISSYCDFVRDKNSMYCLQNIQYLKELINVVFFPSETEPQVHILTITIDETPHICYTFKLIGKGTYSSANTFLDSEYSKPTTNQRQTVLIFKIPDKDLINDSLIDSVAGNSVLHLQVYWLNQLEDTIDITLHQNLYANIVNDKQYQVTPSAAQILPCVDCVIPVTKLVASKLDLNCPTGQTCSQDTITAKANTEILLTQIITDPLYQQASISPLSLKFEFVKPSDNTKQSVLFENYSFENSSNGKITYKFQAVGISSGSLTVTSTIHVKSRLLDSSEGSEIENPDIKYPQMIIHLNIETPLSEQLKDWIFYGMIIIIIFFIFRTLNKTNEKNQNSIENYEQIPKSVEIQMDQ